ncbi:MAG: 3-methylornithyl-N6-L-lysine dehydrogenase PylD [Clostridiales Family XIII bacterium]|jgi:pyrrolysine biosynthesis protein PylD|nr:3-methylornithyl-N6-L-lysine dehydrogenase PylD [Clostridiales Family XIII bacterium]
MTRLTTEMLLKTDAETREYADRVKLSTGMDPLSLAFTAAVNLKCTAAYNASLGGAGILGSKAQVTCCVVPVTAGQGEIGGFTESIESLLRYAGVEVVPAGAADVDGLYRAWEYGADIAFLADDNRYIALNFATGMCCENDAATAYGYVTALEEMAGGPASLRNRSVLLTGCGRVGRIAAQALRQAGAALALYDKDMLAARRLKTDADRVITGPQDIAGFSYLLDATNEGGWLTSDMVREGALISTPGVPLSLAFDIAERPDIKLFHDTLHTGTLVMLQTVL